MYNKEEIVEIYHEDDSIDEGFIKIKCIIKFGIRQRITDILNVDDRFLPIIIIKEDQETNESVDFPEEYNILTKHINKLEENINEGKIIDEIVFDFHLKYQNHENINIKNFSNLIFLKKEDIQKNINKEEYFLEGIYDIDKEFGINRKNKQIGLNKSKILYIVGESTTKEDRRLGKEKHDINIKLEHSINLKGHVIMANDTEKSSVLNHTEKMIKKGNNFLPIINDNQQFFLINVDKIITIE